MNFFTNIIPDLDNMRRYPGICIVPLLRIEGVHSTSTYQFLWEGFAKQELEIKELTNSTVPVVSVTNKSNQIFLGYRGEVIRGGGQNRQLLHSVIIQPGASIELPVQCVQQGRWNPDQVKEFSKKSGDIASASLRLKKLSQSETWATIHHTTRATGTLSDTQDYTMTRDFLLGTQEESEHSTRTMNTSSPDLEKKRNDARAKAQQILQDFAKPLANQVGLYVVLPDSAKKVSVKGLGRNTQRIPFDQAVTSVAPEKILHCIEFFASAELYHKAHSEILSSFAMDAVNGHQPLEILGLEQFRQVLAKLQSCNWQDQSGVGTEVRKEIQDGDIFGEIILSGEEPVHCVCSTHL